MVLKIPTDRPIYPMRTSVIWFDEEGIVYSAPRPDAPLTSTNEQIKEDMDKFRKLIGNTKISIVIETNPKTPAPPKEQRDLIDQELHSVVKAMAVITTSAVSKMIVNLFFTFRPAAYPMKMFTDLNEAVKWIREINQTLDSGSGPKGNFMVA